MEQWRSGHRARSPEQPPRGGTARSSGSSFEEERAATVRARLRAVWVAAIAVWTVSLVFFDASIVPTWGQALAIRVPEIALGVAMSLFLARSRTLRTLELATVVAWSVIAALTAYGFLVVPLEKVPVKVASISVAVLVACLLSLLSWRATAAMGALTTLAISALEFRGAHTIVLYALTIVGFAFVAVTFTAAARDRLARAEHDARRRLALANEELTRVDELRRRLFVNLSHDFRTPLGVILAEASMLRAAASRTEDRASLARIESNARDLAALTDQLLELARHDGTPAGSPAPCDVAAFARDVASRLGGSGDRPVAVTATGPRVVAAVDPDHLVRILSNLTANAMRHGRGAVTISVRRADDRVLADVRDEGPPIPAERRAKIFERFVSFAEDRSPSLGVGLSLARDLAEQNGGSLDLLEERPSTTFRLTLPAGDDRDVAREPVPRAREREGTATDEIAGAPPPLDGPVALLVEDDPDMAAVIARALRDTFSVHVAGSVEAAKCWMSREVPNVIASDVMLPDGTGYDLLAFVRGARDLEVVPVVLVSALAEVEERVRGLAMGADDYLAKPFVPDELRARVRAATQRALARKKAVDAQRDELLMEIHDGVSASLSRAAVLLASPHLTSDATSSTRRAIEDGLDEIRAIHRLLAPRATDWAALAADIRRSAADACTASKLELVFEADGDEPTSPVPAAVAHALRRVAREATTNALRHARAQRLSFRMTAGDSFSIRIEDDGCGLPAVTNGGRGLGIMRRRVTRLGGALQVGTRASGGTFVSASIPRAPIA